MSAREDYRRLCCQEPDIPLFAQDWWLDAVCGVDHWDVCLVKKQHQIVAALPYYQRTRWGFKTIAMPPLTQSLGPWIHYPAGQKMATKLSWQKEVLTELITQLPPFDSFRYNMHYSLSNWLPFHWKGFQQTTRYTYRIENLTELDQLFSSFASGVRTDIQKAQKLVTIKSDNDINKFFYFYEQPFKRQGLQPPDSLDLLMTLDKACGNRNCRKILFAVNSTDQVLGALYCVWDRHETHCLMQGQHAAHPGEGIPCLLRWEAIQLASKVSKSFNFTGSMIEGVERFLRAFGGEQQPYHQLYKYKSRLLRIRAALKA